MISGVVWEEVEKYVREFSPEKVKHLPQAKEMFFKLEGIRQKIREGGEDKRLLREVEKLESARERDVGSILIAILAGIISNLAYDIIIGKFKISPTKESGNIAEKKGIDRKDAEVICARVIKRLKVEFSIVFEEKKMP